MLVPSSVARRIRLAATGLAAAVTLFVAPLPAGNTPTFFLEAIVVSHKVPAQTDDFPVVLRFFDGGAARLSVFSVSNAPGHWFVSAPAVLTASFKNGFKAAAEQVTGNPAKCKRFKFPQLVVAGTSMQGSIDAKYTVTENGIKKKANFTGFVAGNQVQ